MVEWKRKLDEICHIGEMVSLWPRWSSSPQIGCFQTALWVIYSVSHETPRLSNAAWVEKHFDIYYGLVALPFAFFLKAAPRFLLIAAWLLLAIFKRHFFIA